MLLLIECKDKFNDIFINVVSGFVNSGFLDKLDFPKNKMLSLLSSEGEVTTTGVNSYCLIFLAFAFQFSELGATTFSVVNTV